MKKIIYIVTLAFMISMMSGCGGSSVKEESSTTTTQTDTTQSEINLKIGESVIVYKDDRVVPLDSEAELEIIETINESTKRVTLISGSAKLVRGQVYMEVNG